MARRLLFGLLAGSLLLFGGVGSVRAETVSVTATVVSAVSASQSTVQSDLTSVPADGTSTVIITVTLRGKDSTPLPDKTVTLTSNRGEVDVIQGYDGSNLTSAATAVTDAAGQARFNLRSAAPGQATLTATSEGVTLDQKPTVTFTPLPVLQRLTIQVRLPNAGTLTILQPPAAETPTGSSTTPSAAKPAPTQLVTTGVKLQLSFWAFLAGLLFLVAVPALLIIVLYLGRRVRQGFAAEARFQNQEKELLAKIYQLEQAAAANTAAVLHQSQEKETSLKP